MIRQADAGDFGFGVAEIEAFVDFVDKAGLHSFFWRLRSLKSMHSEAMSSRLRECEAICKAWPS